MKLNAYLLFDGTCEAAFKFYEKALGGKITSMLTNAQSPMADKGTHGHADKIMHARMTVGESEIMGSDAPCHFEAAKGTTINIAVDTIEDAERIFAALSENATVRMPIAETFWAVRFGMLVDQFGIPWMVNCERRPNQNAKSS